MNTAPAAIRRLDLAPCRLARQERKICENSRVFLVAPVPCRLARQERKICENARVSFNYFSLATIGREDTASK